MFDTERSTFVVDRVLLSNHNLGTGGTGFIITKCDHDLHLSWSAKMVRWLLHDRFPTQESSAETPLSQL